MPATITHRDRFQFHLDLIDGQGSRLGGQRLVAADFDRAVQATYFEAFRQGLSSEYAPRMNAARIEPRFAEFAGHPSRADGFRVEVGLPSGEAFSCEFPLRYFAPVVDRLRAPWRTATTETDGPAEHYYLLDAFLEDAPLDAPATGEMTLQLGPATSQMTVIDQPLGVLRALRPWDAPQSDTLPIYVARSVIEHSYALAQQWSEQEVGGLLLGNVCRDPESRTVYIQVTCLVDVSATAQGTATTMTFTPECFAAARRMSGLRAANVAAELTLGWMHSHPFKLCSACPLPTPPECVAKVLTYSADDVQLMATTFAAPYAVGLLAGVDPRLEQALGHRPLRCFGWQAGEVVPRGCFVFED